MYLSRKDFYDTGPRRRRSNEADYGAHWRLHPRRGRVSYVRDTGEVYAVRQNGRPQGPVFVLGVVSADEVTDELRDLYYRTLEGILEGWPESCTQTDGLLWARDRLAAAGRGFVEMGDR